MEVVAVSIRLQSSASGNSCGNKVVLSVSAFAAVPVVSSAGGDWRGDDVIVDGIGESALADSVLDAACDDVFIVLPPSSERVASDSRAVRKWCGNTRPRFSARRKIPLAARGVKKNRGGTRLSKTSDKEHSAASLGHSEVAAVEHAPRNPIPAFDHENAEDFRKVSSFVGRKNSGNIFEHKPSGSKLAQDARKLVKESSA